MSDSRKCPICGKAYTVYPATSRKDNKTKICPACGVLEALRGLAEKLSYGGKK